MMHNLKRNSKWMLCVLSVGVILLLLVVSNHNPVPVQAKNHQEITSTLGSMAKGQQESIPELTHQNIVELTDRFMNTIVQPTDENYRVLNYVTIDELLDAFAVFIDREIVAEYVDYYYHQEADGIYILPTETPPWFEEDNDYEVQQVSENKVLVNQYNESELQGNYSIRIEFTYNGSTWTITGITHHDSFRT
ncbi:hypothetical protein CWR48_10505 [Oceanobacillus arenosus]|uniref:DUF3993 domain-containing protein n=1 Tax=Oceanobacillus arenosus TaxID=1229153 RepID=A0A3D8PSP7_9BACI|nr:hypothetical protein [Oceanobacillus arenosus]RDW18742.1 hypothetical protein CWR48_10505 [Oceanobacillus arenosus]